MARFEHVTITVESHSELGLELLPDVLRQLNSLMRLLLEFSQNPKATRVEVVEISKKSPLRAVLRTAFLEDRAEDSSVRQVPLGPREPGRKRVRRSNQPVKSLESAMRDLSSPSPRRPLDVNALLVLGDVAKAMGDDVATIQTPRTEMQIHAGILAQIDRVLGPPRFSRGTVTGVLEGLNVHSSPWSFMLYPAIGPRRIKCEFQEQLLPKVVESIREVVTIKGLKTFRSKTSWPVSMKADSLTVLRPAPDGAWTSLAADLAQSWAEADELDRTLLLEQVA